MKKKKKKRERERQRQHIGIGTFQKVIKYAIKLDTLYNCSVYTEI